MTQHSPKQQLTSSLGYAHAYHQLPVAHEYEANDERYIKNLICLKHAEEQYETTGDRGWKQAIEELMRDINKHAAEIQSRT